MPLRLLVVECEATRQGILMALSGDVVVCAQAGDAEAAIRAAKQEQPDVCLVGAELGNDTVGMVRGICRAAPAAAVVVLAAERNFEDMLDCVRAGAVGYVPGPVSVERLRRIVAAAAHEAVVPRSMVLELLTELRSTGSPGDGLSRRESQVLGMLRRGHSTTEIAVRLGIAPVTVRRHISELVHKLGVENRAALGAVPARVPVRLAPASGPLRRTGEASDVQARPRRIA